MNNYLINENELSSFLKYKILYKWKTSSYPNSFGEYLYKETSYTPDSDFIQNFCNNENEKQNPYTTGVYEDILPADIARYEVKNLYQPFWK